jgi:hypothetical protein
MLSLMLGDLGPMGLHQRHRRRDKPADETELRLPTVHVALAKRYHRLGAEVLEALLHPAREFHVRGRPLLVAASENAEARALQSGLSTRGVDPFAEAAGVVGWLPIVHARDDNGGAICALGQLEA